MISPNAVAKWLTKTSVLRKNLPHSFFLAESGYCYCCEAETDFVSFNPWLRDNFKCSNCGSIPRERALMKVVNDRFPNWKNMAIHESSPGRRGASALLKKSCGNYTASQFYPNLELGAKKDEFVNIDLENQSFEDKRFDIVITQDVMEHVYNPEKAFKEIARTLKPRVLTSLLFQLSTSSKKHKFGQH